MGGSFPAIGKSDNTEIVEIKAKVTVIAISSLFLVLFFIFLIHIYVKWFLNRRREEIANSNLAAAARRRFEFTPGYQELALRRGLDPSVLKTIPVVIFTPQDFKDGLECSVCLCQVSQGEKARLLPKCNHGFHVECIDMWFQSHSSCPICRNLVSNFSPESPNPESNSVPETATIHLQDYTNTESNSSSESPPPSFPTNVLFWGNDVEVRTLGNNHMEEGQQQQQQGANSSQLPVVSVPCYSSRSAASSNRLNGNMLVIDIPHQQVNDDQEAKSPPAPTRLRSSLKRLLSRDTRRVVGPSSPRDFDVDQATRS